MIKGVHTMFYSSDAAGLRTFLRDKLDFKATDAGGGWLIFEMPEADMGCHPADEKGGAVSVLLISVFIVMISKRPLMNLKKKELNLQEL